MSLNRLRKRADERRARRVAKTAARLASFGNDPVAMASRIEELDLMLQGAYAIVHVLARDHGMAGITIPYEKLKAIPPVEHLRVERNRRGDVTLVFGVDEEEGEDGGEEGTAGSSGLDAEGDESGSEAAAGGEA